MRVYTYSEARQNLSELLNLSINEEVIIRRRDGKVFSVIPKKLSKSPFDVPSVKVKNKVTTQNILEAIRESRVG